GSRIALSMNRVVVGQASRLPPGASRPRIRRGRDAREDSRDGCPTTARSLLMVPMRAKYGGLSMNQPTPRPLPGGEQGVVRAVSVPLLGGVRSGFMVPMHAKNERGLFVNLPPRLASRMVRTNFVPRPGTELFSLVHGPTARANARAGYPRTSGGRCRRRTSPEDADSGRSRRGQAASSSTCRSGAHRRGVNGVFVRLLQDRDVTVIPDVPKQQQ